MFKMKNLKILLLLMLFAFAGNDAWAFGPGDLPYRCDSRLKVRVATGQGKVYAAKYTETSPSTNSCQYTEFTTATENTSNGDYRPCPFKILAVPADGYEFDHWECVENIGDYDTDKATQKGTILYVSDSQQQAGSIWDVKAAYTKRPGSTGPKDPGDGNTSVINAVWEAHFKEIITKSVDVQSENTTLGTAIIDKGTNSIGDEVTLTASCNNTNTMFKGWYRINPSTEEKELISKDNPLSFTINNDNSGTYYARFEDGYYFWRIKNNSTQHYISSIQKYTGAAINTNLQAALNTQLVTNDNLPISITDAGTMMQVSLWKIISNTNKEVWDIYVQNDHTNQYYQNPSSGAFLQISHQADNTYLIQGNNDTFYIIEGNNNKLSASFDFGDIRPYGKWNLEGMDKDVTTKENYFAVDPSEFIGPDEDGNYWTTLRVCFNMLYETSEITPYIVTAVDANAGTLELTEVTGGIIPEKTCVLLKCKSTDITRNVMVPTRNTSTFNTSANLLTSSTYYYKNQTVESSRNLKGIKLVDDSRLGFGGDTKTTVDGNRAYLSVVNDVALPVKIPNVTLAELLASGDTQRTYNITDLTAIELVDHDRMLICKDNNGYVNRDERDNEEYIDFMHTATLTNGIKSTIPASYDQSNWIGLRLSDDKELSYLLKSYPLKGVVGKLTSTVNPEFILEQAPEADGEALSFTPNVYIAASFNSENHQSGKNGKEYFFVVPKPMEYANVEWAQWDGEKFIAPVHDASHPEWNQNELRGEFEFNGSYLEQGGVFLEAGHSYEMLPAIIKYNDGSNNAHVYVLGNVNGQGWSPRKGVEMSTPDGKIYTTTVTVDNAGEGYGYFSFTKKLGGANDDDWAAINSERFGANTESMNNAQNYPVDNNNMGQPLPLRDDWSDGTRAFKIATGTYRLTVNLKEKTLIVTAPASYAPSLKAASGGYTVYPLQINKVTTEENGVITALEGLVAGKAVARVVYYNMMGVASDKPHQGINIVVTEYSDGSRTAVKMLR